MFNKIYDKIKQFIEENKKFLIILIILNLLFWIELPYVIYTPGGAIDLEDRIKIEDENSTDGKLQMAYVSMVKGSIPFLLTSFVIPDWDIVSKSELTLENESMKEMLKKDKIQLQAAIDSATIAAYSLAGEYIKVNDTHNKVIYITDEAETNLKLYDEIISVNDIKVNSIEEYKKIVESSKEGEILKLKVLRNKKEKTVDIKVYNTDEGLKTGISFVTTYDYDVKREITVKTKSSESGPSGGTMMALSIYNDLTKDDISNNLNIVGTGTIDKEGNVGEIGGVKYKLIGAVKKNADVFIVPKENYEEAKKVAKDKKYDIIIITDESLSGLITRLKDLSIKEK